MGDCRGLKSIYRSDPQKRKCGSDKDGDKNDHRDDKRPDEEDKTEEECDKDPHHAYMYPNRSVHNIFSGKVALENGIRGSLPPKLLWPSITPMERLLTLSIKTGRTNPLHSAEVTSVPIFQSQGTSPLLWTQSSGMYGLRRCSSMATAPSTTSSAML
jgi:hypothetical protein